MQCSCSIASDMTLPQRHALARFRHQVFVQRLGWQLDGEDGLETDQFDHDGTLHLVATEDDGEIVGCARLLPTTGPYLLGEVFPELLNGAAVPASGQVWELSRFACGTKHDAGLAAKRHRAEQLMLEALRHCAANGVRQLLAVTTPAVERIMRRAGVDVQRFGPPVLYAGDYILACVIDVNTRSMQNLARAGETSADAQATIAVQSSTYRCAA